MELKSKKGRADLRKALEKMLEYFFQQWQDALESEYEMVLQKGIRDFYEHEAFFVNGKYGSEPKYYDRNYFLYESVKFENKSTSSSTSFDLCFYPSINYKNMFNSKAMRGWDYEVGTPYVFGIAVKKGIHGDIKKVKKRLSPSPYTRSVRAYNEAVADEENNNRIVQEALEYAMKKANVAKYYKAYVGS